MLDRFKRGWKNIQRERVAESIYRRERQQAYEQAKREEGIRVARRRGRQAARQPSGFVRVAKWAQQQSKHFGNFDSSLYGLPSSSTRKRRKKRR